MKQAEIRTLQAGPFHKYLGGVCIAEAMCAVDATLKGTARCTSYMHAQQ